MESCILYKVRSNFFSIWGITHYLCHITFSLIFASISNSSVHCIIFLSTSEPQTKIFNYLKFEMSRKFWYREILLMFVLFFKVISFLLGSSDTVQFVLLDEKITWHFSVGSSTLFSVEDVLHGNICAHWDFTSF